MAQRNSDRSGIGKCGTAGGISPDREPVPQGGACDDRVRGLSPAPTTINSSLATAAIAFAASTLGSSGVNSCITTGPVLGAILLDSMTRRPNGRQLNCLIDMRCHMPVVAGDDFGGDAEAAGLRIVASFEEQQMLS